MLSKKEIPPKIVEIQGFVWLITQALIQSAISKITPAGATMDETKAGYFLVNRLGSMHM